MLQKWGNSAENWVGKFKIWYNLLGFFLLKISCSGFFHSKDKIVPEISKNKIFHTGLLHFIKYMRLDI